MAPARLVAIFQLAVTPAEFQCTVTHEYHSHDISGNDITGNTPARLRIRNVGGADHQHAQQPLNRFPPTVKHTAAHFGS